MHYFAKSTVITLLIGLSCAASGCKPAPVQTAADVAADVAVVPEIAEFKFADAESETTAKLMEQALPVAEHFIQSKYDHGFILAMVTPDAVSVKAVGSLAALEDPAHVRLPVGSITKVFVGMQLASMVLDGTVSLDTPLTQCTPEGVATTGIEDITLKMLTTHTSGLPRLQPELLNNKSINPFDPYTTITPEAVWNSLSTTPRNGAGTIQYSNYGEAVLGNALTQCAHAESWASLMSDRVTRVLGLDSVSLEADANAPQGYDIALNPQAPWTWNEKGMAPAGALQSNILDLSKLLQMSMTPGDFKGKDILTKSQEILVTDDAPNAPMTAIAMNWIHGLGALRGIAQSDATAEAMKDIIWHNGQTGTFNSYIGFLPQQQIGIVVLGDGATGHATDIGMLSLALAANNPSDATQAILNAKYPAIASLSEEKMRAFEGDYLLEPINLTLQIRLDENGNLFDHTTKLPVFPTSENELRYRAVNASITFVQGEEGAPQTITFTQDGQSLPVKKVQ